MIKELKILCKKIRKFFDKKPNKQEIIDNCSYNRDKHCRFLNTDFCYYPMCDILQEYCNVKVIVYNKAMFDSVCEQNGITDSNVENQTNVAFISIVGTDKSHESKPYFRTDHSNVINLEFDDVDYNYELNDHRYVAMSEEQADKLCDFIEKNKGKTFYIHCMAGVSRSQAVSMYIQEFYEEYRSRGLRSKEIPPYNGHVKRSLARAYYKKNNIFLE